jgi:hypothetical protein
MCMGDLLTRLEIMLTCLESLNTQLMIIIQSFRVCPLTCRPKLYRDRHHNHVFIIFRSIVIYMVVILIKKRRNLYVFVKIWHLYCVH